MSIKTISQRLAQEGAPAAFYYEGAYTNGFSEGFELLSSKETKDEKSVLQERVYRHAQSGTEWTVTVKRYPAYRAVQWQAEIYAPQRTGVFSQLGYRFTADGANGRVLGNLGDEGGAYAEFEACLTENPLRQEATDGRPTHGYFPYYRLETDEEKLTVVLSWQGTWFAEFSQGAGGVEISMGQRGVYTYFEAGERFRLPMVVVQEYDEDPINDWRRFYMDCHMPLVKGKRIEPLIGMFNGRCDGLNEEVVRKARDTYEANGIDYDFWWFDAGWGTDGTGPWNKAGWWYHGVNLEMNEEAFPDGLASFGKELAQRGKDFMLWFEPEVVRTVPEQMEQFYAYHPEFRQEWFLGTFQKEWCGIVLTGRLLDLSNPECLAWVEKHVFEVMDRAGVNIYRQDFNIPPAEIWAENDGPNRKGITENKYCVGYLQFLRDIQARYPGILMDSCASGGGRNELETMQLMLPLHYSDHQDIAPADHNGHIYMQQIMYRWFPYVKNFISLFTLESTYAMRAIMNPSIVCGIAFDQLEQTDFSKLRGMIEEWRQINRAYAGDYYELERATNNDTDIKAFEFYNREENLGFVMVFCPAGCEKTEYTAAFQGLDAQAQYRVESMDTGETTVLTGKALSKIGVALPVGKQISCLLRFSEVK